MKFQARVVSLNVGRVMPLATPRGMVRSGIVKQSTGAALRVERDGFVDDQQADHVHHGGPQKAVYAYASEDLAWWSAELGRELPPGLFGENLTTEGLDLAASKVGDRWTVGTAELMVTDPRVPCSKFAARMEDPKFPRRFARALRTGLYLAVTKPGEIAAGDEITVLPNEGSPSIREVAAEMMNVTAL